jgi:arsenite methyltransferase
LGCIAGASSRREYEAGLAAAGFEQVSVVFTHQVGDGLHSAIIKATKPTNAHSFATVTVPASQTTLPLASDCGWC